MTSEESTNTQSAEARQPSRRMEAFCLAMAVVGPPIYMLCELRNWPLFTYHPGTNQLDWFYAPAVKDWGPAMHWYGWTASALIGSALLGGAAALLPRSLSQRIPRSLGWLTALMTIPPLVYGLRFYWR